jgi:DNA-binding NtrC family response regulator
MLAKILVVDDEEGIRNSLCAFMKMEGYEVASAEDGQAALEKIRAKKYNIVLMDGLETLKEIKKIDFSTQVIIMTAYSTFDKTMKALEYGATDYIMKPFDDLNDILRLVQISEEKLERWKRNMSASIIKQRSDKES